MPRRTIPPSRCQRLGAAVLAALLSTVVVAAAAPTRTAAATGTGTGPSSVPFPLQEFVSDHLDGHVWNAYDQTVAAAGPTILGTPSAVVLGGSQVHVYVLGANDHLYEFINDDAGGRVWNAYDQTAFAGNGVPIESAPDAIYDPADGLIHVYVESAGGDLVEYLPDHANGNVWNVYDLTADAGGTVSITGTPHAVYDPKDGLVHVYVESGAGHLVEFLADHAGGRVWNAYDHSLDAGGGGAVGASPSAILDADQLIHVYVSGSDGHLMEYLPDHVGGHVWNAYDHTVDAGGGGTVSGSPSVIADANGLIHVYVSGSDGHLMEYLPDHVGPPGRVWNAYDHTADAGGATTVTGSPAAVVDPSTHLVHVFIRSSGDDLVEFLDDHLGGRVWNVYDHTVDAGPQIGTDVDPVEIGGVFHLYAGGPFAPAVVQRIVQIATGQDQYFAATTEDPMGSNCNVFTAYWGRGSTSGCAPGTSAEEWCSDFAQWVWQNAGVDTSGITAWSYTFVDWGMSHVGAFKAGATNDPEPGDAVVWGDQSSSYGAHVGIVIGVSAGQIDVVSGNWSDRVWDQGYFDPSTSTVSGYSIIGYISPVDWTAFSPSAVTAHALSPAAEAALVASQDGGH